jgi:hypothetical protein
VWLSGRAANYIDDAHQHQRTQTDTSSEGRLIVWFTVPCQAGREEIP